jgi:ABC-type transporter Mla subunit MlaD
MPNISGFWSYVHDDNENDGGAIVNLANRLMDEYALLSGESLKLFVDRDLEWGDEWKRRIDEALQETTFFIPIITPRYFKSDECRREFIKFRTASEEFGVEQLLLPIYYVEVPEMEVDEPEDKLMAVVKTIQREDMRKIRLKNETDADHRAMVNGLASRLLKIATETDAQPTAVEVGKVKFVPQDVEEPLGGEQAASSSEDGGATAPVASENVEGFLEVLAAGEEAIPKWGKVAERLADELRSINEITEEATAKMTAENESGTATFASRLAAANRFAHRLDQPADNLATIGQEYSEQLITVDPAVQTLIRLASENEEIKVEGGSQELFSAIRGMTQASRDAMAQLVVLADAMQENSGMSRELRRPLRKMETSLRNISDGQEVLDDWEKKIDDLFSAPEDESS